MWPGQPHQRVLNSFTRRLATNQLVLDVPHKLFHLMLHLLHLIAHIQHHLHSREIDAHVPREAQNQFQTLNVLFRIKACVALGAREGVT